MKIEKEIQVAKKALEDEDYEQVLLLSSNILSLNDTNKDALKLKQQAEEKIKEIKNKEDIKRNLTDAKNDLENKDYHAVITSAENILELDPDHKEGKELKEQAERKLQEIEESIKRNLAETEQALKNKDYQNAFASANKVLEIDPENETGKSLKQQAADGKAEAERLQAEKAKKEEEQRIAQQKENERKTREVEAQKRTQKNSSQTSQASSSSPKQVNTNSSSTSSNQSNVQSSSDTGNCVGQIKGSNTGIYHVPGSTYYSRTKNVAQWFCSEQEAINAGYRAPKR